MKPARGFAPILIVAIVALVIGAVAMFGYQKFVKISPVVDQKTETKASLLASADETKNWKTYTNKFYEYSFSYPVDAARYEEVSKQGTKGREEQIVIVNYGGGTLKIVGNSCGIGVTANKQTKLIIAGITTDKYYESDTKTVIKAIRSPKGDEICISGNLPADNIGLVDQIFDKILSTFKFTSDETANWETYTKGSLTLKYPKDYKVTEYEDGNTLDLSISSADEVVSSTDLITKGGRIRILKKVLSNNSLDTAFDYFLHSASIKSKTQTIIGGKQAFSGINTQTSLADESKYLVVTNGSESYLIQALAAKDSKMEMYNLFDQILSTFRFE